MNRLIKWCVLPAVLVAGLCVATPQANAGGFSFSFSRGYPSHGYGGSYYGGQGCDYGYGGQGYGQGYRGGYGGYGGYGGHGHCDYRPNWCW